MNPPTVLSNFVRFPTTYTSTQDHTLEWILAAHTMAEEIHASMDASRKQQFQNDLRKLLERVSCKAKAIETRGHMLGDFLHQEWHRMELFQLKEHPRGLGLQKRQELHQLFVDQIFEYFYPSSSVAPHDLVHVSCTGYASPSGGQKIAAKRNWTNTTVTHLYHMGCYAAIPALRVGSAFSAQQGNLCHLVHTELCSLHINPLIHDAEQLVAQSLFADGSIRYDIQLENRAQGACLKILGIHEHIIPDSSEAITWTLSDWGFLFGLAKEVPALLAKSLKSYVSDLCLRAKVDEKEIIRDALFAVHPGGPKILDHVQKLFNLDDQQLEASRAILRKYGNMSSATLPHIWQKILEDAKIPSGQKIISLAFGPGVTIAGTLLEKQGS